MNQSNPLIDKGWNDFYGKPPRPKRHIWRIINHPEFLWDILRRRPRKILEVGIGTASHSCFLSYFIPLTIGIDNDFRIAQNAKTGNKKFGKPIKFVVADAFHLPFKENSLDLCFSQGFFEHFNNIEIEQLINEQLRISKEGMFSVPSYDYASKDYGNERLLKRKEWLKILNATKNDINVKYSFIDMRFLEFFLLKRFCIKSIEVIAFIRKKC